jgi:hypothetical protein
MKLILILMIGSGLAAGVLQRSQIVAAQTAIAEARERQEKAKLAVPLDCPSDEDAARMRADRRELIRLRASFPELRTAPRNESELRAEIARIKQRIESERSSAKAINDSYEAQVISKTFRSVLTSIASLMQFDQHGNITNPPRSFVELERRARTNELASHYGPILDSLAHGYAPHFINRDHFEFLPAGPFIVRERTPRRLPDGSYLRLYLPHNIQPRDVIQKTPDFSAWEASPDR